VTTRARISAPLSFLAARPSCANTRPAAVGSRPPPARLLQCAPRSEVRMPRPALLSAPVRDELRATLALLGPILVSQLSQAAYGFVDAVMAGQVSPLDLAGVPWAPASGCRCSC